MPVKKQPNKFQSDYFYTYPNSSPLVSSTMLYKKDQYIGRCLKILTKCKAWAGAEAKIIMGEMALPAHRTGIEARQWQHALDCLYAVCQAENIPVFYWSSGHGWGDGTPGRPVYFLAPFYKSLTGWEKTYHSPTIYKYGTGTGNGVNYGWIDYNQDLPASVLDMAFHKQQNIHYIRFQIENQNFANWPDTGVLIPSSKIYIDKVFKTLNACQQVGMKVMIDPHDYAKWGKDGDIVIGPTNRTKFHDFYRLLLNLEREDNNGTLVKLKDHPAVFMIDVVNEPCDYSDPLGIKPSEKLVNWELESQLLVDVIRSEGFNREIAVPLMGYCGVEGAEKQHPNGPWIKDIYDGKIWYDMHQYFAFEGGDLLSYDGNLQNAQNDPALAGNDWGYYSNNKAISSAKLMGSKGLVVLGNGSQNSFNVPAGTTKTTIVVSAQDQVFLLPANNPIKINGQIPVLLAKIETSYHSLYVYEFDNLPVGNNNITVLSSNQSVENCIQFQFWSGLKLGASVTKNVVISSDGYGKSNPHGGVSKFEGSVSLLVTSLQGGYVQNVRDGVYLDSVIKEIAYTNHPNNVHSPSIYTKYRQNSDRSVFTSNNYWDKEVNVRMLSVEFQTDDYKILPPNSVV
jgi:Cellulase (glycosyl hydrolase family 5)